MRINEQKGISLVELLVAMTLGLVITGGVIQVVTTSNATYNDLIVQSRMQETAKLAVEFITRDLRNVGYVGCDSKEVLTANVIDLASNRFFNLDSVVNGYQKTKITGISTYDTLLQNADLLEIYVPDIDNGISIVSHTPPLFTLPALSNTQDAGAVWMVVDADCSNTGVFVQSNSFPTTPPIPAGINALEHASTSPSNCSSDLRGDFDCGSGSGSSAPVYTAGSKVYPMKRIAYGIRPSATDATVSALVSQREWEADSDEVLLGVSNLQIIYGLDLSNNNAVERYATAGDIEAEAGLTFAQVVSIRLTITVEDTSSSGFADQDYTATIRLRNRGV